MTGVDMTEEDKIAYFKKLQHYYHKNNETPIHGKKSKLPKGK